jgi:hypothetical protein
MIKRLVLMFFCICISFILFAQTSTDTIFANLQNGAILVRLQSKYILINALQKRNDTSIIKKIIKDRDIINQEIIDAFNNFTYCPVYYFYSENSKKITNREFKGILLDNKLNPIDSVPDLDNNYLIATFGLSGRDTTIYAFPNFYNYLTHDIESGQLVRNHLYYNLDMEPGISALVLLHPDLYYVNRNYPHYVRTFENPFFVIRPKSRVVHLLELKISRYVKDNERKFNRIRS